jgi:two-component system chemotaxis response regulator CheB
MKKIKVIIVDDSKFIRTLLESILSDTPDIEVVAIAEDPYDAREKIKQFNPDVITLDIEMPKMDGLSFLEKIMKLRPMPVVMVSTLTKKGADITLQALELGAVSYVTKPSNTNIYTNLTDLKMELSNKIREAAQANIMPHRKVVNFERPNLSNYKIKADSAVKVIAIGASTGGVEAIREVVTRLPSSCPPVVITQHMPATFTEAFANRLNKISQIHVVEAQEGHKLLPGNAYIAPGDRHMKIRGSDTSGYSVILDDGPLVSGHKPSVDVMFESVASVFGQNCVGVILTGMGKDGADGLLKIRQKGASTIGQSESSCVVYGMPRVAKEIGAVEKQFAVEDIAEEVLKIVCR